MKSKNVILKYLLCLLSVSFVGCRTNINFSFRNQTELDFSNVQFEAGDTKGFEFKLHGKQERGFYYQGVALKDSVLLKWDKPDGTGMQKEFVLTKDDFSDLKKEVIIRFTFISADEVELSVHDGSW